MRGLIRSTRSLSWKRERRGSGISANDKRIRGGKIQKANLFPGSESSDERKKESGRKKKLQPPSEGDNRGPCSRVSLKEKYN